MPVELPPLRTAAVPPPEDSNLPSLSSLASPPLGERRDAQPRLPLVPQMQLPTAPNSPAQQQLQLRQQPQDSRMNVAALLG